MRIKDKLTEKQLHQMGMSKKDKLSQRDIEDLMDKHKTTYKRHRGSMRKKEG